jgi:hypothetical protein
MTDDPTENVRMVMLATGHPQRAAAEAERKLTTEELRAEYDVLGFLAPIVVVRRKSDGVKGSMEFTHNPRFYFNFVPD